MKGHIDLFRLGNDFLTANPWTHCQTNPGAVGPRFLLVHDGSGSSGRMKELIPTTHWLAPTLA